MYHGDSAAGIGLVVARETFKADLRRLAWEGTVEDLCHGRGILKITAEAMDRMAGGMG